MTLQIYNTLTRTKEEFVPQTPGKVNMYVCGPTVYNYIHIGNARSTVAFDTVRKYLEYRGFDVNYVSNFTDVDDKIIRAAAEAGISTDELSEKYIAAFFEDTSALGVSKATTHPRATEYIQGIIDFNLALIEKGYAYESQGDVYFRVNKSDNYGALANKNIEELEVGASGRVDEDADLKEDPLDFALWKSVHDGTVTWDSPWGKGRPGWHIECSVMSTSLLGETLDIHAGGQDLEFPHHTNEIAQSEAKTGHTFANYWMHNGFVTASDGEKMSKSLGNFKTVHDMIQVIDPQILRFFLVSTHYRRPLAFSEDNMASSEANFHKIKNAYEKLVFDLKEGTCDELPKFKADFDAAMDDDFNIENGLTAIYELVKVINQGQTTQDVKVFFDQVLTVLGLHFEVEMLDSDIEALIEERQVARQNRDFARADAIRDELKAQGIQLLDTPEGVRWTRG